MAFVVSSRSILALRYDGPHMVNIVLHTHLPWVLNHGAWPHGSDWVCEATAECYLPLLDMCRRLVHDGITPGITFTMSPVLAEQLAHPAYPALFSDYCTSHAQLARADHQHLSQEGAPQEQLALAEYWERWYLQKLDEFTNNHGSDIIASFRELADAGAIEIITCGATHGYLPLLAEDASVRLQVALAQRVHHRHFGRRPSGMWMPECAYRPAYPWRTLLPVAPYATARPRLGVETVLNDYGMRYTVVDEASITGSAPIAMRRPDGTYLAIDEADAVTRSMLDERSALDAFWAGDPLHRKGMGVFARSMSIALQVWSGQTGYPGDPDYLDFHKKFFKSSLRYWRVTDVKADMAHKDYYRPEWAVGKAQEHAAHFVSILGATINHRSGVTGRMPTVCLPFDTELFGHWWFEGPVFLEHVLRGLAAAGIQASTLETSMSVNPPTAVVALPESSWGRNGNHDVWMHSSTQWMWEREYRLEHRVRMLFEKHSQRQWSADEHRVLGAMMREVVLAQASDWPFLVSTGSAAEYASMRFHNHVEDALALADACERLAGGGILTDADEAVLVGVEQRDALFPEILDVLGIHEVNPRV